MNITSLFEAKREQNKQVVIDKSLNQYKLSARKHLELHIKLSSLADETKCYKYWVGEICEVNRDTVFEKYLSCLSQVLIIGIDSNYTDISEIKVLPNDYCLSDQFLNLYIDINDLIISPSKDHYQTLLEDLISLGVTLGYSENKIIDSFISI